MSNSPNFYHHVDVTNQIRTDRYSTSARAQKAFLWTSKGSLYSLRPMMIVDEVTTQFPVGCLNFFVRQKECPVFHIEPGEPRWLSPTHHNSDQKCKRTFALQWNHI